MHCPLQCSPLHTLLIISFHPQPIDVSSFYRRELHETMQPRKLKSMWQLLGGCRGGNETGDGESGQKKGGEEQSEKSSTDEETTVDERVDYGRDRLDNYGLEDLHSDGGTDDEDRPRKQVPKWAEGSDLMTALLNQCSMPPDQIFATVETPDLSSMFTQQRKRFFKRTSSACWEQPPQTKSLKHADGPTPKEVEDQDEYWGTFTTSIEDNVPDDQVQGGGAEVPGDDEEGDGDQEGEEAVSGAKFLHQLDQDYLCSPRLLVRGIYDGDVLQLVVKRKTEGTYVDWAMFNTRINEQVLNIKGEMTYPFALSRQAQGSKFGHEVMGGWGWRGYGYGYAALFPTPERADPTKILHVDIHEAIFFGTDVPHHYHVSGRDCKKVTGPPDAKCKQDGCGLRIWSIMFTTYETADEQVEYYQPKSKRKDKLVQNIYLSMVAFFDGHYKIVVHRDVELKKVHEEVAWLTKDENAKYNDSVAAVDRLKVDKARRIWETTVPKSRTEGATLAGDGGMSDGDVGQAGGGNTLTANVSNRRSKVVWLFGHLLCLFVVRVERAPFICITTFVVSV